MEEKPKQNNTIAQLAFFLFSYPFLYFRTLLWLLILLSIPFFVLLGSAGIFQFAEIESAKEVSDFLGDIFVNNIFEGGFKSLRNRTILIITLFDFALLITYMIIVKFKLNNVGLNQIVKLRTIENNKVYFNRFLITAFSFLVIACIIIVYTSKEIEFITLIIFGILFSMAIKFLFSLSVNFENKIIEHSSILSAGKKLFETN